MSTFASFLEALTQQGYASANPRPRLAPALEQALEAELDEEVRHGEKEPTPTPALPGNVRLLTKGRRQFLLYVLESALEDGFWGVNRTIVRELHSQPLPWALVLLNAGREGGYGFAGPQVLERLDGVWPPIVPGGPNHEVRAPAGVAGGQEFHSPAELVPVLDRLAADQD